MFSTKCNSVIIFLVAYFITKHSQYYSVGAVAPEPEKDGNFKIINSYEKYTDYVEKSDRALVLFIISGYDSLIEAVLKALDEGLTQFKSCKVDVYKVAVEENRNIADYWDVGTVPKLLALQNGAKIQMIFPPKNACSKTVTTLFNVLCSQRR